MSELAVYQPAAAPAVPVVAEMDSWIAVCSDVIKVANVICDTPFVPEGLRGSGPATAAAILAGRELGLGPMTSLANIHVIKGKPSLAAVLMRALIQGQGHDWQDGHISDVSVTVRGRRRGETEWAEATFTAAQAKIAGITLGGYPQDKLYARATSRLARRKFADVIAGMPYSAEELEDGDEQQQIEQAAPAAIAPPAAPRTAQRRQAAAKPAAPTAAATAGGAAPAAAPAGAQTAPGLPPLPGEDEPPQPDETDYDTPGTAGNLLTPLWATFSQDLGFTKDEKQYAREACEKIIGRKLTGGTTGNLSRNEASACIDTLKRCGTRGNLVALLAGEAGAVKAAEQGTATDGS